MRLVREFPETFLDLERARAYQALEPANPRLRGLLTETGGSRNVAAACGCRRSLSYYKLSGPFTAPRIGQCHKAARFFRLAHGPACCGVACSYEAERRMMRAPHPRAQLTQEDWKKQRGLLRFTISAGRLTGLAIAIARYIHALRLPATATQESWRGDRRSPLLRYARSSPRAYVV